MKRKQTKKKSYAFSIQLFENVSIDRMVVGPKIVPRMLVDFVVVFVVVVDRSVVRFESFDFDLVSLVFIPKLANELSSRLKRLSIGELMSFLLGLVGVVFVFGSGVCNLCKCFT